MDFLEELDNFIDFATKCVLAIILVLMLPVWIIPALVYRLIRCIMVKEK